MKQIKPQPGGVRTPEQIQAELVQAERAQADAQTVLDRLMADRPGILVNGSDADLKALDDKQRQALVTIERQVATVDGLRREWIEVERAGEQARRRAIYDDAKAKADVAAAALAKTYPTLVKSALGILQVLAEGQAAVREANLQLPAGAEPIVDPEFAVRSTPGLPQEVVSDTEVELWARMDHDQPVDAAFQAEIYDCSNGWGKRTVDQQPAYRLRRFRRREIRDSTAGVFPHPLAAALQLPNLKGERMAWGESFPTYNVALAATMSGAGDPDRVLVRLAEMAEAAVSKPAAVQRPTRVVFEQIGDVEPLPVERVRPETTSRREVSPTRFGSSPFAAPARAGRR